MPKPTPLRTLVIEDQQDDYTLLIHELRRAGFDPTGHRVDSQSDFLAHLDPKLDLILSDFSMPGFSGLEALRLMKQRRVDVPFIFVSGTIGEEIAVSAMQEGASDYLIKDRLARLGPAVSKVLAQWKLKEEKQLAEQTAARLAAIVESSSDAIITTTLAGVVVTWNKAAERLYGYAAEEMVGKNIALLVPSGRRSSDVPEDHENIAQRLPHGELIEAYEAVRVRKDGRRVDVAVSISPILDSGRIVLGASFIAHDISQRKRAERFLAAEHAVTRILADSPTLEDASSNLLQVLADSLRWEAAVLWQVDRRVNRLRRVLTWHAPWAEPEFVQYLDGQAGLDPEVGLAGRAWACGEPLWESCSGAAASAHSSGDRLRAAISIPMRLQGQMVGAIEFYNPDLRPPDAPMLAALANIASQISQFSERRQSEAELRASEQRYRTLIAATSAIVWDTPISGLFETAQPQWTAFTGQSAEQLRGWGWLNAVHPEDQETTAQAWLASWKGRTEYRIEHRLRRADGEYRYMSVRAVPIVEPGGGVREWVGVHADVTDQKRAEDALRATEEEFRTLAEAVPQVVWITQPDGGAIYFNQKWMDYTGMTLAESVGHGWNRAFHSDDQQRAWLAWENAMATFGTYSLECRLRRADGVHRWWLIRGVPQQDAAGHILKWFGTCTDIDELKQAEALLRTSEARFKALIEKSFDAVALLDADGTIRYVTPAAERVSGWTPEEFLGTKISAWKHPEELAQYTAVFCDFVGRAGGSFTTQCRLRHRDGTWRWMESTFTNLIDDPDVRAVVVNLHDITERRRAEDALRLRDRAIRAVSQGIVITDPNQHDNPIVYISPGFQRLTGYTIEDAVGRNCRFLQGKDTDPAAAARIQSAIRQDQACKVELLNYRKDGTPFWNDLSISPVLDPSGRVTHFVGVQTDVTERRQLEDQFRQAQLRLRQVVSSSPAVLFTLAVTGERTQGFSWVSENLQEILGHPPEATLDPDWWMQNIHPEDRGRVIVETPELLDKGCVSHEYRFRHGDGGYRWTRSDMRLARDGKAQTIEVVGAWSDITASKLMEDQFHQAQKMDAFGQLAGGVAHDFNNLLTVIIGYSQLLLQTLPPGDSSRALVTEINNAGERSAGLTRQLLAFSRQQVLAPRVLDLSEVVTDTNKMLRRLIGEDVRLTTTLNSAPWAVRADPGQLEQVLLNLAVNARDAMPKGGQLTIETRKVELDAAYVHTHADARVGPHVLLSVADTGIGMPPEVLAKIFEPFFTTKEPGKGTGLGLATVYGIVKQSGGHITVHSEVGIGTTFTVYLPRIEQLPADSIASTPIPTPPRGTETLLLAEDEAGVRALTGYVLAECGYKVLEAADGEQAMRVAAEYDGPIHLLVSDVVMPGAGGRAVAEDLIARHPKIRVLFVSGYTDDAVIRHGVLRDGVHFLQKPFSPVALAFKVREVLDKPVKHDRNAAS